MLTIQILDAQGVILDSRNEDSRVSLVYPKPYQPGDTIELRSTETPAYLVIQPEDSMAPAFVYLSEGALRFAFLMGRRESRTHPNHLQAICMSLQRV